ncbi:putative UPF0160 protein C27H6.8 [Massarina eburnea CBS 473.64]|uniref:Putative UPF0160 protein C27H6.8 n=1 Tax=Massarina eburnea CBS 473.64 TaxID=1395130 RepID=A0A6A6RKE2_9PLEO|nr:putative UPF0160 protein C27H6.8 [Massarina eburnea CBS 473.64]
MAAENPAKKMKMDIDAPLIGTHNGHFHADEALAVSMLRLLPTYAESPLVRTRDLATLAKCHTVVDVGAEYDDARKRYDHHQKEFTTVFPGHNTKLSSAGLVYMHFGKEIIAQVTGLSSSSDVDLLYEKIYTNFIEAFDANDNGVSIVAPADLEAAGLAKKFEDRGFSIASVVNRYNYVPNKGADSGKSDEEKQAEEDARFAKASTFVGEQFEYELSDRANNWLPAYTPCKKAFDDRFQHDSKGRILVLNEGLPFMDHLYNLEKDFPAPEGASPLVLYVLLPEDKPEGKWRIRAVSKQNGGFVNRKDLPDAWKGVRDEKLDAITGCVPGAVFVHAAGFIGGHKSFEGALQMAQKAVEL